MTSFQTGISGTGGRIYIKNVGKCIKRKNYAFCKCSIPWHGGVVIRQVSGR